MKKRHDCINCYFRQSLEDSSRRIIYFCVFDQSPGYLGMVGVCSGCELDGFAEELYCKQTEFYKRIKDRQRVSQLKKEMDKKVKELQGLALYKMMAEYSPELKTMLSEYEELTNNG